MNGLTCRSVSVGVPSRFAKIVVLCACAAGCQCAHALQAASPAGQQGTATVVQPGAPGTASRTLPSGLHAPQPQRVQADVDFMQGMVMHHGQAVEMTALIPSHTTNPGVTAIGQRISRSQTDEMAFMKRWLRARGEKTTMDMPEAMPGMPEMTMSGAAMPTMPGMLSPAQMEALRNAHGAEFDRLFLTGMIQHHTGALTMVHDLFNSAGAGQDADLFDFATDVDNTQRAEIRIMQGMLHKEFGNGGAVPAKPHE